MYAVNVAVLVGGYGKRMGMDKAEIILCGRKLIDVAISKFRGLNTVFVCRDEEQAEKYRKKYDAEFIQDVFNVQTPLAGIHAALRYFDDCIVTAVDMPFIKRGVVKHLYAEGRKLKCDALIPKERYPEPLLAYYSSSALEEVEKSIKKGQKRILAAFENLNVIFYPAENLRKFDKQLISFFNINTPEDLKRAEELCSRTLMDEL
jgi:molybdopterin-guanine dinucleotide biosynthesis protein A